MEKDFEVTKFWINPWGENRIIEIETLNKYDFVLFFQKISPLANLRKLKAHIIWVQMYDSANFDYFYWKNLSFLPIRVLAFSEKIEAQCKKYNIPSLAIKYYLNPKDYKQVQITDKRNVLFWYRGSIKWSAVRKILNPSQVNSVIYLSKPDPGYKKEIIDQTDIKKFNMTIIESEFMPTRNEYLDILSKTNIFISPRLKEGIGVSMLEAIASGHCVIAHNDGTMNEYIVDNKNGYLFDTKDPKLIDLSNIQTVTLNSRMDAEAGYKKWLTT
jgi:glycosyltransferase involved in cell wall biosynthesis